MERRILRNVLVWDSKTNHAVAIDLDVAIDIEAIARRLAGRAYNNKRRKSFALGGMVEVAMRGTKATPAVKTYPEIEAFAAMMAKT